MNLKYMYIDDSSWYGDLMWFEITTKDEDDYLMDIFVKEMKLNMKYQFQYEFNYVVEEEAE